MFAVRATFHTTLQATPSQLVFGRDAILNTKFEADWNAIRARKRALIEKNNQNENAKRRRHTYRVGDKVFFASGETAKYGSPLYNGPYIVEQVNNNGTLRIRLDHYSDTVNIRQVKPYFEYN
jgi:hypothetical protein